MTAECQNRDVRFIYLLNELAQLVIGEGFDPTQTDIIYSKVRDLVDDRLVVNEIMDWIMIQYSNGSLRSTLEFVFQTSLHQRYHENFLITGLVPDHIKVTIESLRLKGILTESICDEICNIASSEDAMIWTTSDLEEVLVERCGKISLKGEVLIGSSLSVKINESFHS